MAGFTVQNIDFIRSVHPIYVELTPTSRGVRTVQSVFCTLNGRLSVRDLDTGLEVLNSNSEEVGA